MNFISKSHPGINLKPVNIGLKINEIRNLAMLTNIQLTDMLLSTTLIHAC